jgi:hypothetical protein
MYFCATHIDILISELMNRSLDLSKKDTEHSATTNLKTVNSQFRFSTSIYCLRLYTLSKGIFIIHKWAFTLSLNDGCFQAYILIIENTLIRTLNNKFETLIGDLGCFPFEYKSYHLYSVYQKINHNYSKLSNIQ